MTYTFPMLAIVAVGVAVTLVIIQKGGMDREQAIQLAKAAREQHIHSLIS
jgi:predicted small secreted protein